MCEGLYETLLWIILSVHDWRYVAAAVYAGRHWPDKVCIISGLVITVIQCIASSNLMRQLQVHDTKVDMGMEVAA